MMARASSAPPSQAVLPSHFEWGSTMHFAHPPSILPSSEYDRLQRLMLTMIGSRSALATVLRRKLGATTTVTSEDLDRNIALHGASVRFRVDGQPAPERTLSWQSPKRLDGAHLSLLSPRGLALLGLSAGQSISYRTEENRTEFLEVEHISSQRALRSSGDAARPRGQIFEVSAAPPDARNDMIVGRQHA